MNIENVSQNIVFNEFEDKAFQEFYNIDNILFNKDILNFSNHSVLYGITFKYCFTIFENFITNKDKNRSTLLIALEYIFKNKKYLNAYSVQNNFIKILYSLMISLATEYKKYENELNYVDWMIGYILKESFKKVSPLEHHLSHKSYNELAAEFLHSQGYISSLEFLFNLNKYERKDYIDDTVVNFYNSLLNIILNQFYNVLKIKNKEEFTLLLINNKKNCIDLRTHEKIFKNMKTYETSLGFTQFIKPNNEIEKQIILNELLNSHLYLSYALIKNWFENYEY